MAAAILQVSNAIGAQIIAEGIETEAEAAALLTSDTLPRRDISSDDRCRSRIFKPGCQPPNAWRPSDFRPSPDERLTRCRQPQRIAHGWLDIRRIVTARQRMRSSRPARSLYIHRCRLSDACIAQLLWKLMKPGVSANRSRLALIAVGAAGMLAVACGSSPPSLPSGLGSLFCRATMAPPRRRLQGTEHGPRR